ncbi:YhjD/YihY/BrkB family envelope integrity protein [Halosolutus amylolyticus]|uniref:YhjD/YihY/BrkB family envelope integrity protein n=1 Tax=Halosolutus amylolyticus TaxID=2932267 RepID=A0ABD5PSV9_9EURY|nr:YhjD/YihY/BrkB family envelope integrity protein [Halosolutus amylolyticus]
MTPAIRGAVPFVRGVVAGIQEKNVPFMAASIAYQAFISLIPLLVLVFFLVSIVGDEQLATEVGAATEGFLPESGQLLLENAIEDSPATAGSSIIGLVVVLWGSLKIFRGLDTAFSEIYGSTAENSFVDQLRDALIAFGAIGIALLAAGGASVVFAFFPDSLFVGFLNPILLVVGLTLAFLPMYYRFPDVDLSVREVLPGVVVAAVGWAILQSLFQVYVSFASDSESAGPVGAILLVLTWLYFGGLILLSGAVVNATYAGRIDLDDADTGTGTIDSADREPSAASIDRERDRLAERATDLTRERNKLRQDLAAQRDRRYELEDRVDRLERTTRELEQENEALRQRLETRRDPPWKRSVRAVLGRIGVLRVGTIETRSE